MNALWRPAASLEALRSRAGLLDRLRSYFRASSALEVETPTLSRAGSPELHIESLSVPRAFPDGAPGWLAPSPEFHLKRLLATGSGDIYTVAHVFRAGEAGALHNPEFTLAEWYRVGVDLSGLMDDIANLIETLLPKKLLRGPPERLTYREAFLRHADVDPFGAMLSGLQASAGDRSESDRDVLLDRIVSGQVYPRLGDRRISLVHDFPATQASLARIRPGTPAVAERVEAIVSGVELANGFVELSDAGEQCRRFRADLARRAAEGREQPPLDERFLAALESGLPACAGAALGFDRLVMLALGAKSVAETMTFPADRA